MANIIRTTRRCLNVTRRRQYHRVPLGLTGISANKNLNSTDPLVNNLYCTVYHRVNRAVPIDRSVKHIRSIDCLGKFSSECGAKNPSALSKK
jgi:hypothetical protein